MLTFVAVLHILVAIILITLVLLQDSKGGAMGGIMGGSGSNSLLGATGATTLFEKLTRWGAILFAMTCLVLTVLTARKESSLLDTYVPPAAPSGQIPITTPEKPAGEVPLNPADPAKPETPANP